MVCFLLYFFLAGVMWLLCKELMKEVKGCLVILLE